MAENIIRQEDGRISGKLLLSIIAAGLMTFCGVVVETSMNITFPVLMKEFGVKTATVQWITSGYLLVLAVVIPTSSFLGRRFTTRRLFTTAAVTFIIGTVLCAAAPIFPLLLLGRMIQGIGTGIALPLMYNIVLTQVPESKRGMMMGVASLIPASAPAIGPSLGGLVVTHLGWRMIFVLLLPILVFALIAGIICIRNTREVSRPSFDASGWLMLLICFASIVTMLSLLGTHSFMSAPVLLLIALAAVSLWCFCRHEGRMMGNGSEPLINLNVFRCRRYDFAIISFDMMQFICLGLGFLIPNYGQIVLGRNAMVAGCILLPGCILGAVCAPLAGRIYDRKGAIPPLMTGASFVLLSTIIFLIVFRSGATVTALVLTYLVFCIGQVLSTGNGMTNGLSALPVELNADGNAVFNTLQQLFGSIGTAVCSAIVAKVQETAGLKAGMVAGADHVLILLFILGIVVVTAMWFAMPKNGAKK